MTNLIRKITSPITSPVTGKGQPLNKRCRFMLTILTSVLLAGGMGAVGGTTIVADATDVVLVAARSFAGMMPLPALAQSPTAVPSMPLKAATPTGTVTTDETSYLPGTTVMVTGSGWKPGTLIDLSFAELGVSTPNVLLTAAVDPTGNFYNSQYQTSITSDRTI